MVQGDKEVAQPQDDTGEIDRIMKEIEELEKNMGAAPAAAPAAGPVVAPEAAVAPAPVKDAATQEPVAPVSAETNEDDNMHHNVVPLHADSGDSESLVESDAVLTNNEPLMKSDSQYEGDGALALKVGGCAEVQLEFTRAGVAVTLHCSDDGLSITTDQAAEVPIPFRNAA